MANKKQKLELTWIGKDEELKLEPRILIEDPAKSHGDPNAENMLIHGDNLLTLKALEQDYSNKIKCIFIDPPYNTGSAFEHYDDNLEHSTWLNLMKPRLILLRSLLNDDGLLWITLDENESHYCKVICDEIFGRNNYLGSIIWQHSVQGKNDAKTFSLHHNYILVYSKTENHHIGKIPRREIDNKNYSNPDNDPKGSWRSGDVRSPNPRENLKFIIKTPGGNVINPPQNGWRWSQDKIIQKIESKEIIFSKDERRIIRKIYLSEQEGRVPESIWFGNDVGTTREANSEIKTLFNDKIFDTPKPERLIERIIGISTKVDDWVLDSFLGSGTTSAVAHKMSRKWIGVELGEHATTHCLPRLKKVVDGNDRLPLSEALSWKGGGGFKFFNLAPSLLSKDGFGNYVIDEQYNQNMLAAAMCKFEGFKYSPDETLYWKQGKSTETDFIFVTTNFVTLEQLDSIHTQMQENESLLICAKSYIPECENHFPNITVKKIPQIILGKCEFGKDNYDLNIIKVTEEEAEESNEVNDE